MAAHRRWPVSMLSSHLLEEELEYELQIRKLISASVATREEKEALLEEHGNLTPFAEALDELYPVKEIEVLSMKVSEVKAITAEIESNWQIGLEPRKNDRLNTSYAHTLFRVRRMMYRHPQHFPTFRKLASKLNAVWHKLNQMYTSLAFPKICTSSDEDSEEERSEHEERKKARKVRAEQERRENEEREEEEETYRRKEEDEQKKRKKEEKEEKYRRNEEEREDEKYRKYRNRKTYRSESSATSSDQSSSEEDRKRDKKKLSKGRRNNPVTTWAFRYNGSSDRDLYAFIEDVEDAADINNVSDDELLRGIGALLTDDARTWHRGRKKKIGSWTIFKREICSAFSPADNDEEVMDKINSIRQKSDKTFAVYEARCSELSRRLSVPLSERDKLKRIYKGLHLFYSSRIRSRDFDSVRALRRECRDLEADKHLIQKKGKGREKKGAKEE
ncbi:Activity-regulated cytoskeleton associated protein 1 [Frankliniella fusca]|uniref:Activity-regulated cytoskeleton associated protein 1 n=1 Tax=Frankliniella fusca TaxID=407009 RepID=A0AAE1I4A1_9NEOP|nr:Activity-regulated cytoskeleton associated protein 1 [Frankliniella fusca]KAK3932745.1 Activity-regulated cytoskeleton associated protein 1 [Frankliniella fusca]